MGVFRTSGASPGWGRESTDGWVQRSLGAGERPGPLVPRSGRRCTSGRRLHTSRPVPAQRLQGWSRLQAPPAPLAPDWIDAQNPQVRSAPADYSHWWAAFDDPTLNNLIKTAYEHNVTLRVAGTRVLEAQAQRAVAVGFLFPQQQTANGGYSRTQVSRNIANVPPNHFFDTWTTGLNATWEIDFWGKIRRQIESADDLVDSSVDDYDAAMVSLIGDTAAAYVQYRTFEQQLAYARENVRIQRESLKIATAQWKAGKTNELPVVQASSLLQQLEATIPLLEIGMRQTNNLLCVLLGVPATQLADLLGEAAVPEAPKEIVVGIPADLIRRRPDLRRPSA